MIVVLQHPPCRDRHRVHSHIPGSHVLSGQLHVPLPRIRNVFAVVCDTSESGKRKYPRGSLNIYDEEHSDFRRLQRVVLEGEKITSLIEQTQIMSLRIFNNTVMWTRSNAATSTVATHPSTPVQQTRSVIYRVKAALGMR